MKARPSRCTVIDDSPTGVRAAVAAGMRAIGYAANNDQAALRDAGGEVVRSLQELPGRLGLV